MAPDSTEDIHSTLVVWLKVILPLAAIALLSTLFLFARDQGGEPEIPFAQISEIAEDQRISAPTFTGVTDAGAMVMLSAERLQPSTETPGAFDIRDIEAEIDAMDGSRIEITAGLGAYDPTTNTARLQGLAQVTATGGYVMETEGLIADFAAGTLTSLGPLEIRTPFGALTAGQLNVLAPLGSDGQRMVFNEGVRLLYTPQP